MFVFYVMNNFLLLGVVLTGEESEKKHAILYYTIRYMLLFTAIIMYVVRLFVLECKVFFMVVSLLCGIKIIYRYTIFN
jgi:hypothetical protein